MGMKDERLTHMNGGQWALCQGYEMVEHIQLKKKTKIAVCYMEYIWGQAHVRMSLMRDSMKTPFSSAHGTPYDQSKPLAITIPS